MLLWCSPFGNGLPRRLLLEKRLNSLILLMIKRLAMACGAVRIGLLLGCCWVAAGALAEPADPFPRPPQLEPAVQFWTRVYTEVDTGSGFLHDAYNLSVIYARLPLDRRQIENRRNRIRQDLQVLANGKRHDLTSSQAQLLALWPPGTSNATLRKAADNVRWQLGQSDRFVAGLQRSGAYRAHIHQVIGDKNLPIELAVLPHVESSFNPGAYSSAAAAGMWQFGRATGRRFMRIDHIVDERMDPYIATHAAMNLLEYNYSVLGTWPLALTAYNHGAGGIARAVRQTGTTDIAAIIANYQGRAFGFASRNFYAQFLAVLDVERDVEQYFGEVAMASAPDFRIVTTDAYIDAAVLARSVGVSMQRLRADNPALRPAVWQGNKRIPRGFPIKLRAATVPAGDLLARIPVADKFAAQTPDVAYVVERGDSLSVIAQRFNTTVSSLVALNQLQSRHRIRIGQRLLLPQGRSGAGDERAAVTSDSLSDGPVVTAQFGDSTVGNGSESMPEPAAEQPATRSGLADALLPPAAVLPDNQQLDSPVTQAEQDAVAIDPTQDVAASNQQLVEALAADPSDYTVAGNNSIEIQAEETLGHYAEWLGIRARDLRRLNGMVYQDPLIIGERLQLDFRRVSIVEFERSRRRFHSALQREFFAGHHIQAVETYQLRPGDNIDTIARERDNTPIWLLRQYNPGLDLNHTQAGQEVVFPLLEQGD